MKSERIGASMSPNKEYLEKRWLRGAQEFHELCMSYKYPLPGITCPKYETGSICGNIIGDRIRYIKEHDKRLDYTSIARQAGIGRNSLMRYLRQKDPDIPKPRTLLDIITKGLHCTPEDFYYSPEDFSEWEKEFSKTLNLTITEKQLRTSYEDIKKYLNKEIFRPLTYEDGGTIYPVPHDIADILRKQLEAVFLTIDFLLDYEMKSNKPRGLVEPYLIETIPGLEDD